MNISEFKEGLISEDKGWYITKQKLYTYRLYEVATCLFEYKKNPLGKNNFSDYGILKGIFTKTNYRQARNILYLGLAKEAGSSYADFEVSLAFKKLLSLERDFGIKSKEFEDFLINQTEKMFFPVSFSDELDRYKNLGYGIFPIIFVYKIFTKLYETYRINEISINKFKVLIASTKRYDDWENKVKLLADSNVVLDSDLIKKFNDVRFHQILKGLRYFEINNSSIKLKTEYVEEIKSKIDYFEKNNLFFEDIISNDERYKDWLAGDEIALKIDSDLATTIPDYEDTTDSIDESETILKSPRYYDDIDSLQQINNRTPMFIKTTTGQKVKTDPRLAKTALAKTNFTCECDSTHISFIDKSNHNYIEAHHLVPIKAQKNISQNIDRLENIVALCPNCHKAIHLGNIETRMEKLTIIFNKKQEQLKQSGIPIDSIKELFDKYYK